MATKKQTIGNALLKQVFAKPMETKAKPKPKPKTTKKKAVKAKTDGNKKRIAESVNAEKSAVAGAIMKARNDNGGLYSTTVAEKKLKSAERKGIRNADASPESKRKALDKAKGKK